MKAAVIVLLGLLTLFGSKPSVAPFASLAPARAAAASTANGDGITSAAPQAAQRATTSLETNASTTSPPQPEPNQPSSEAKPNQAEPKQPAQPKPETQPAQPRPEPEQPNQPEPAQSEPAQSAPAQPLPETQSQPDQPEPAQSEPAQSLPETQSQPNQPNQPNQPEPVHLEPNQPAPTQSHPEPQPNQPEPVHPDLTASEEPPARPQAPGRDFVEAFNDWLWERTAPPEPRPVPDAPDPALPPQQSDGALSVYLQDNLSSWLGLQARDRMSWFGLFFLLALCWSTLRLTQRARQQFSDHGLLPGLLRATSLALRLAILLVLLLICSRLLPSSLRPGLVLGLLSLAVALGFGTAWWVLPDVLGGLLLLVDSRIQRGQWICGEGFAGRVEGIGPSVTRLRLADGTLLMLPNRLIATRPVRRGAHHGHLVEVELRAQAETPSGELREALREAVLCSPYVPPDAQLLITRDTIDPHRWQVRVRLTSAQFAAPFRGELLERLEDSLRARARASD